MSYYSTFIYCQGVARSPTVCLKADDENRVVSVKSLVYHLISDLSFRLLHFRCHVRIVSLGVLNKKLGAIVSNHLVGLIHWYEKFKAGPGMIFVLWDIRVQC